MNPVLVTVAAISINVQFQYGEWGNSIERSPISSAEYGTVKGNFSAGR
jgi:hypothetical protein